MNAGTATSLSDSAPAAAPQAAFEPPFKKILCGIDGSRSAHEAARQAAVLVAPGGTIDLVAVAYEWGAGMTASATLSRQHAHASLVELARDLRQIDAHVTTRVVGGNPPWQVLLEQATGYDLIVVARHSRSRFGGVALGRTAANLVHRAHMPVLIAAAPPEGAIFPGRILVAADGPGHPERAVRLAGQISRQTGSDLTLLRLDWSRRARRPELAEAVAELNEQHVESIEILVGGTPHRRIPEYAEREGASLVIVGSRGLSGPRAISSVSERVAHEAPCSVLVVRPTRS